MDRKRYKKFELQIRSADMHKRAEYGSAAHRKYKGALASLPRAPPEDEWPEEEEFGALLAPFLPLPPLLPPLATEGAHALRDRDVPSFLNK